MTIIGRIQTEFLGISALISAFKRAWKAYQAYNKAVEVVNNVVVPETTTENIQKLEAELLDAEVLIKTAIEKVALLKRR